MPKTTIPVLTARSGFEVPEYIRDLKPFTTHGNLRGDTGRGVPLNPPGRPRSNQLNSTEWAHYDAERRDMDYIVWSYDTPIAWHTPDGWHKVHQTFSPTTSKHQGRLYLITDKRYDTLPGV